MVSRWAYDAPNSALDRVERMGQDSAEAELDPSPCLMGSWL